MTKVKFAGFSLLLILLSGVNCAQATDYGSFRWTGFYLGANAGYTWSDADFSITPTGSWLAFPALITNIKNSTEGTLEPKGFIGGVQAGFNQQHGSWLWGIEVDLSTVRAEANLVGGPIAGTSITSFSQHAELSWMATVRGRLGMTFDRLLVYGTAGVAFGHWDVNMHMTSGPDAVFQESAVRTGWVVGGGLEYAFDRNWSLKGEYLYAKFGDLNGSSVFPPPNAPNFTHDHKVELSTQVLRAGLNFKF